MLWKSVLADKEILKTPYLLGIVGEAVYQARNRTQIEYVNTIFEADWR